LPASLWHVGLHASAFELACWAFVFFGVFNSFRPPAPYGRHQASGWGPMMSARLGWILQEAPSAIVPALCFALLGRDDRTGNFVHLIMLTMWLWHYTYRSFFFPFLLKSKPTPIIVVASAFCFTAYSGFLQGYYWSRLAEPYPLTWLADLRFLIGAPLWFAGWIINFHSDWVLSGLRKPGESGYKIPRGGAFDGLATPSQVGLCQDSASGSSPRFSWAPAGSRRMLGTDRTSRITQRREEPLFRLFSKFFLRR